jgi:hypothetical protein
MDKRGIAAKKWKDAVFGKVIHRWLKIFDETDAEIETRTQAMATQPMGSSEWNGACDELETFCKKIYEEILESGFKHLEEIKRYHNWEAVIDANVLQQVYH